jgi:hypothetical protein
LPKNDPYISLTIVLLKITGPTILLAFAAYQTPTFKDEA